ncbi:sensor histidine kinase [Sandaracinobacteroides saxicola]|uniref:histidine kinase n=1 Tax=Sandaracinobacteroides saxicola TaxID=2759707 RepID=A0A7G5IF80_9SPHN|nr:ATP-binding protein [Sandaracinobacteroides saxicola]QMW22022.1 ATPase [Sandaracinobacteroides saxicola]
MSDPRPGHSLIAAALGLSLLLAWPGGPGFPALAVSLTVMLLVYAALMRFFARREPVPPPAPVAPDPALPDPAVPIDALAEPALLIDPEWRVLAANPPAIDLFGPRITSGDVRLVLRHPQVLEAVRLAFAAPAPVVREVSGVGRNDAAFRVRAVAAAPTLLLLTFADITQARLTERMRVDFVANASHELRTPLATIGGFIETLQGPAAEDEPARRRFLDIMAREAARMSRLIDDLLSLSRIELDKYVRPQDAVDLAPLLADVGKTLAMRLEADGRALRIETVEPLPKVIADRDQILQVLHNLVSNSLKYGRAGTPIRLSAAAGPHGVKGEAMIRVAVADEGEGIAPEHLPRLTERFYRVDTSRSRSMGGTGLGLAIVKHIVERHRGRLDIHSRQGEGTEVSFTLPLLPEYPATDAVTKP